MSELPEPLPAVDEDWTSALAIVAHPDDLEYGAASAIARWTGQGKRVAYALATSGEAGIDGVEPERCGALRELEERAGAAVVGVDDVEFLGLPDGTLEYGLLLRRELARVIRRHRPDVVITGNYRDWFGPGARNQADHVALGRATIDAVRDAANRWVFRDLLDVEGLSPWTTRAVLVAGSPEPTHGVDVTDSLAAGVRSLEAHGAYLAGLADHPSKDPQEFLESIARSAGPRLGTRFAVLFEVIPT